MCSASQIDRGKGQLSKLQGEQGTDLVICEAQP